MFIFKIEGIDFEEKFANEPDRLYRIEAQAERYEFGEAVGYEIVCSDGSFRIHKWCLQSCDELEKTEPYLSNPEEYPGGTYPLMDHFQGMIL